VNLETPTLVHLARLARLRLGEAEAEQLSRDLSRILEYFAVLDEWAPRTAIPAPGAERGGLDRLRADEAVPTLARAEALSGAPETDGGAFTVPAVVRPDSPDPAAAPEPEEGS
jgi:aspartyl-tRNA(Asn)/glutamyl-tRNA(Gln) amidotransferase subunit C